MSNTENNDPQRAAAFAALREHPDFDSWMNHDPGSLDARGCRDLFGFLLLLLGGVALSLVTVALLPQLAVIPIALVALGAVAMIAQLVRRPKADGPLVRRPASILQVHAQLSTGGGAAAENSYVVEIEEESGARLHLEASPEVASNLRARIRGIAFSRGPKLVHFATLIAAS